MLNTFPCFVDLSIIVNPNKDPKDPGTVAALKELIQQRSKFPLEQMVLRLGGRTLAVWEFGPIQRLQRLRLLWIDVD